MTSELYMAKTRDPLIMMPHQTEASHQTTEEVDYMAVTKNTM